MVYVYAICVCNLSSEGFNYLCSTFQQPFMSSECTSWIRRSTGRLCTELTPSSDNLWLSTIPLEAPALSGISSLSAGAEIITTLIDSLTLVQYHFICTLNLRQYRRFDLSASTTMNLGAVFHCSSDLLEDSNEIAFLPTAQGPWIDNWTISEGGTGEVMPNGWTRFQAGYVFNNTLPVCCGISRSTDWYTWLSQANHIFRHLHIMSNFEEYVFLHHIEFQLEILRTTGDPPEGFLFLCPGQDFQTAPSPFRCPACIAYWSLDPSGVDPLSPEDATQLGFPTFELTATAYGSYWDASVYEGLRQFHEAKGFDPYSQDVAHHLGHLLLQLSSERDSPMDSDGEDFDGDMDSDCNSAYIDDYKSDYPTSACHDSDLDVDTESSHNQKTVHDRVSGDGGSEHGGMANCEDPYAESIEEEMFAPSRSLNLLMSIQLALILFLGLSWGYDHVVILFG
ncbi:hypothetical protein C8R45DRAFT_523594 [Mycena sanguinolenta]|nr:hypothetical protein C8R45DRAFT_523594 [Mycena sanguinolenta]